MTCFQTVKINIHNVTCVPSLVNNTDNSAVCMRESLSYVVNSLSLDSILRCLIHILVSAEPISLVAPGNQNRNTTIRCQNTIECQLMTKEVFSRVNYWVRQKLKQCQAAFVHTWFKPRIKLRACRPNLPKYLHFLNLQPLAATRWQCTLDCVAIIIGLFSGAPIDYSSWL